MRKILSVFLVVVMLCCMLCVGASAQSYSTVYPSIANSGSPLWLHCHIDGFGEAVIVIDPNTNPQAFGFDTPENGYNIINNTADTIYGRAYFVDQNIAYNCQWASFYTIALRTGTNNYGQAQYTATTISHIYGTTLDLIDYTSDRGNDLYKNDIPEKQVDIIVCACLVALVLLLVCSMVFKPKLFRM